MKFSTHLKIWFGLTKRKAIFLYNHEGVKGFIFIGLLLYASWYILQLPSLPKR